MPKQVNNQLPRVITSTDYLNRLFIVIAACFVIFASYKVGVIAESKRLQPEIDTLRAQYESAVWKLESKTKLSYESIDFWMTYYGITNKSIVLAQIKLETNNLQSDLCKYQNNLFGLKMPHQRETTAIAERNGDATYSSFISCLEDYSVFQQTYYNPGDDYYEFLKKVGYAEDSAYISKLRNIVKSNKE